MARSSRSRSRSPGPWRGRDRETEAMACVGPRVRGPAASRSSLNVWAEQHERHEPNSRGGKMGAPPEKDVYGNNNRAGDGGGGSHTHKQRGSSRGAWNPHAGGGGGRMLRGSGEDGRGEGDRGSSAAGRRSPPPEGRGTSRLRSSSSSNRRTGQREGRGGAGGGGGAPAAPAFHGYFNAGDGAASSYDRRSSGAWGQQRETRAPADSVYSPPGSPGSGAAAPPYTEGGPAAVRLGGWLGDHAAQNAGEEEASAYSYYQGVGSASNAHLQHQQQFAGGGGRARAAFDPAGAAAEAEAGRPVPEPPRAGGGAAAAAATAGATNRPQTVEDDEQRLLYGPLLNFKQFVVMKPDECTQKELSRAYEAYVERYKKYHAEQFFEKYGGHAFMRELYHPNSIRRQHELRKARAKLLAQAFLQKYQQGFFSGLGLDADSREIRRVYLDTEEDSPLLLKQWPSSFAVPRGWPRCEGDAVEVVEVEDDVSADETEKRDDVTDEQRKDKRGRGSRDEEEVEMQNSVDGGRRRGASRGDSGAAGVSARRSCSAVAATAAAGEDGDAEAAAAARSSNEQSQAPADPRSRRWPPYVLLPSAADCLVIHAVDPSISSLEIFDELSSEGVVDVAMVPEGDDPTEPRTAFVFFSSSEAKRNYKQRCSATVLKLTKPVVTVGPDGEEQETLKVFSLPLCDPPASSFCEAFVTPPAACTPSRLQKDLEMSATLILALDRGRRGPSEMCGLRASDRQMGVYEEENSEGLQHPLLSTFPEGWSTTKRLDVQITYLRQVHALCYYSGELCKDLVDVNARCGKAYLRPRLPLASKQAMLLHLHQQQTSNSIGEVESGSSEDEEGEGGGPSTWKEGGKGGRDKDGGRRRRSSVRRGSSSKAAGAEEEEQQENEMEEECDRGEGRNAVDIEKNKELLCVSRPQRRWLRQLDQKLLRLLNKIEKMQESLPAALEEETPIISLKWNAFCHEKVFEDDEHKHRCRLCNKPFKAPHFVFKHLRKKHEEELNFIIERYASIVMKEAYMKDPAKPLLFAIGAAGGENHSATGREEDVAASAATSSAHAAQYGWGYGRPPTPAPTASGTPAGTTHAAGGWPSPLPPGASPATAPPSMPGVAPPTPYGVVFMPERSVHVAGTHPVYAPGAPPGGVITHPVAPPSSQYYPFGAFVPPHVVYGGATHFAASGAVITPRRRDWDAPEPVAAVLAPAGAAAQQARVRVNYKTVKLRP